MTLVCTVCDGSGFVNIEQVDDLLLFRLEGSPSFHIEITRWINTHDNHDVAICRCCGDGDEGWYGEPGEHYGPDDPCGQNGPYADNGGLCECH